MYARIWVTAPDENDGYFVEIISSNKTIEIQEDCAWFKTVQECHVWANSNGTTCVEEI
jgi:hypothetical protein